MRAAPSKADIVIFTDGFFPDPRRSETGPARVGAVFFDRRRLLPAQFSEVVTNDVLNTRIPRATQIFMVELVAIVLALETFRHYMQDATVLLLVDAEAVEGALVKGYSARSDVSLLVGKFWELAQVLNAAIYIDRVPTDANALTDLREIRFTLSSSSVGLRCRLDGFQKSTKVAGPGVQFNQLFS